MIQTIADRTEDGANVVQRTASGRERILPKLPSSWVWTNVGELAEVFRGASPRPKGDPRYFGGSIPWIMISDVTRQPGKYLYGTREGVTDAGAALSRRLGPGSLIVSNSGTICVPKILKVEGCIHDGFIGFKDLELAVDLDFAYWWFEYVRPRMIDENRQGMTQVNLNTEIVREIHFPLAPGNEQPAIVQEIEKQTTRLDAATAALKRAQANLKRYRASVLKAACEGRLVPTEARLACREDRDYEPADKLLERILRERRSCWETETLAKMIASGKRPQDDRWKQHYKEPSAPDTANLPELPEGWCWASVDQVGIVQLGRQRSPAHHSGPHMVPYLRVANVFEDRIDIQDVMRMNFTPAEQVNFGLRYGDILLNEGQSLELIGRPAMFRDEVGGCCFQNTLVRFRAIAGLNAFYALTVFLGYFHSGRFQKIAKWTTNIAHLGAQRFAALEFPLPPIEEQLRITEFCQGVTTHVKHLQEALDHQHGRGSSLRQSILSSAFTGQLVPQDCTDESASALLKRIREERRARDEDESGRRSRKELVHA